NGALADISHAAAEFDRLAHRALVVAGGRSVLDPVFYVHEGKTAGIFVEIGDGILAGDTDPAEVHFHGDEFCMSFGEEKIVSVFAAEGIVRIEFERVIVVAELDASFGAGFAGFVEEFGGTLPAVGRHALFFVNPRANDVAMADDFGGFDSFWPLFFDDVVADVAGRGCQAIFVEDRADVFRGMIEVTGELDFLVAGGSDLGDGAFKVGFHGIAHGVELYANAVNGMRGRRAACMKGGVRCPGRLGGGCETGCDGGADKWASIHGLHFTISRRKGKLDLCESGIQSYFLTEGGTARVSLFPSSIVRKLLAGTPRTISAFPSGQ